MIEIIYTKYDFRHTLDIWQDEHPNWRDDIAFVEIKNKFFNQEKVRIHFGLLGNIVWNGKRELFFNDTLISFSDSPFCLFYADLLDRLFYGKEV